MSRGKNIPKHFNDQQSCWVLSGISVTVHEWRFILPYFINIPSSSFCAVNTHAYAHIYLSLYELTYHSYRSKYNFVSIKKHLQTLQISPIFVISLAKQEETQVFFCIVSISRTHVHLQRKSILVHIQKKDREKNLIILGLFRKHQLCSSFKYDSIYSFMLQNYIFARWH